MFVERITLRLFRLSSLKDPLETTTTFLCSALVWALGCLSSSSGGNQPSEAIHTPWQRTLGAVPKFLTVSTISDIMQTICTDMSQHSFDWSADGAIEATPRVADPSLMHGALLPRFGRTTVLSFATRSASGIRLRHVRLVDERIAHVAVCRTSASELDQGTAVRGIDILCGESKDMQSLLMNAGIRVLVATTDDEVRNVLSDLVEVGLMAAC